MTPLVYIALGCAVLAAGILVLLFVLLDPSAPEFRRLFYGDEDD